MATLKVGGEVDAFCTKCRMTLAHTILAMVGTKVARVRCNTCGGDHAFRAEPGASTSRPSTPRAPKERATKVIITFEQQLQGKDLSTAQPYSPQTKFEAGQILNHPSFGYGIVQSARPDKIDVAFKAMSKTLVHARGGATQAKPSFSPPKAASSGPADKPLAAMPDEASDAEPTAEPPVEEDPADAASDQS